MRLVTTEDDRIHREAADGIWRAIIRRHFLGGNRFLTGWAMIREGFPLRLVWSQVLHPDVCSRCGSGDCFGRCAS